MGLIVLNIVSKNVSLVVLTSSLFFLNNMYLQSVHSKDEGRKFDPFPAFAKNIAIF